MFLKQLQLVIGFSLIICGNVEGARILAVVSTPAYSHQMFFQQIWRTLALKGHDVVVITTDPTNEQLAHLKEISIRESYVPMKKFLENVVNSTMISLLFDNKMFEFSLQLGKYQMQLPQVQELMRNQTEHFDLLMVEIMFPITMAFKYRFNCPMIALTSLEAFAFHHALMGNPTHSLLYPLPLSPNIPQQGLLARLFLFIINNVLDILTNLGNKNIDSVIKEEFGEDSPGIYELFKATDMLFINANPLFVPIRPLSPATINLAGGIHLKPEQPLPKDIKDFLDEAKEGAIYFSLGSNVKSNEILPQLRTTFMNSLARVPYKVLYKFEDETLPGKPHNVKITKWAPQQDVLRHKNVKLFITQGGIQSLEESLYCHVPVLVIPFFGDQHNNARNIFKNNLGLSLDRHNLKEEDLVVAITEIMENRTYERNMKKVADRIQDEPMQPLERAIWWTEYVLRHKGAQHLKGPHIPAYQYYYIDVFFVIAVLLILLGFIVLCIYRKIRNLFSAQNIKMKKL